MKYSESKNRYSLIQLESELKQEPNKHINYQEKRVRSKKYNAQLERNEGWEEYKVTQTQIVLRKYDPEHLSYEKRLWLLFFKMGFIYINKQEKNTVYYGSLETSSMRFSIFGGDKDHYSFIFLDCFTPANQGEINSKIAVLQEQFVHITNHFKQLLEDNDIVFKYIIAIKGFELTQVQEQVIKDSNFTLLTEIDVEYFEELYSNLANAAYYQFCGKLFEGMTIPKINTRIPAIRGSMGGNRYYAFSIDPHVLLRLSFVLHKTKAHEEAMPTYQRLVKKSRLTKITNFLNNHGFFPNSIVINLDKECTFEKADGNNDDYDTEIGYLVIPQKYRVAYIIDGQHRLMGYAGCQWANQQIPVVAFERLNKATQVKLFMEMNENQKAVPKELRLTLLKDLLPSDPHLSNRLIGLKLQIIFSFVDNDKSPLRGYVGDGVDRKEFTLDYLQRALKYSSIYFGKINTKTEIVITPGIFFRGDPNDPETFEKSRVAVRDFLFLCVKAFVLALDGIETLDNNNKRNVFIRNIGMDGFLRFVADVVEYKEPEILQKISDDVMPADPRIVFNIIKSYLDIIFEFTRTCEPDEATRLTQWTGERAPVQYLRTFQRELHGIYDDFNPKGLDAWMASTSSEVVEEAQEIVGHLKRLIKKEFTNRFSDKTGVPDWISDSLPNDISTACFERQRDFNRNATSEQIREKTLWDFVRDDDYFKIACHSTNDPLIKEDFTFPGMKKTAKRDKRYEWIKNILKIEKGCIENHSCESSDLEQLRKLFTHFLNKDLIEIDQELI